MRVFSNLAISLDGKIADRHHPEKAFGTAYDRRLMKTIREKADVVVFGAETLRVSKKAIKVKNKKSGKYIVNCVVSASGQLDANLEFWQDPNIIRFVFTTDQAYKKLLKVSADRAFIVSTGMNYINPNKIIERLVQSSLSNILVEGGGTLMRSFVEANLIDEYYLTLTPWLIGGASNPSLIGGEDTMLPWKKLKLLNHKKVQDEIYLHYKSKK